MDFALSDEHRMLKDLVARFVREELMPLERVVLEREAAGQGTHLTEQEIGPIDKKAKEIGLWGLDAPEDVGGADLPEVAMVGVLEELGKTVTPYVFPPDSPNLRMLKATVNAEQRAEYLAPYAQGKKISAIGISEPGAGADPASMTTTARRDGGHWTYEVSLEDCRIPACKLLGQEGQGFAPMQLRLSTRRLLMACSCIGMAQRALDMMCQYAPQRITFGVPLAERQTIQWWVADGATRVHAARLMAYD